MTHTLRTRRYTRSTTTISLPTPAHPCPPLPTPAHRCPPLPTPAHPCPAEVRVNGFPSFLVSRHPVHCGVYMQTGRVVWTAFPMPPRGIQDGSKVVVEGVVSKPELNGRTGTVLKCDLNAGRCSVLLDSLASEGAGDGDGESENDNKPRSFKQTALRQVRRSGLP